MLAWFYVCIAAVRNRCVSQRLLLQCLFLVIAAQWLTTSAACSCTAAASRLPILRCMQRYELQSYDEMQAPSQPGKLVHHHASTRYQPRRSRVLFDAPQTRPGTRVAREEYFMRNPHQKNRWQSTIDTRILPSGRATEPFAHTAPANAVTTTRVLAGLPPGATAALPPPPSVDHRHHCRAHGPPGHRRQDV